ncbi:MAG: ABC transporter permease subunit [Eubacteriales bacterium]|nr:ABC transporter permease subunit [Eubacteriales bacterium]
MNQRNLELKVIFWVITGLFGLFLVLPIGVLLLKSLGDGWPTLFFFADVLGQPGFLQALGNSFTVAALAAVLATALAFCMAYAVHYTALPRRFKSALIAVASLPMYLPTITYGFAIIYSFGRQGLITRLLGRQLFDIYGMAGLLVGYVIYTVPVAFLLIHNTMGFVDKKPLIVSKVMGDRPLATFRIAVLRPLLGTLAGAFIQAFFLCFTDFGIPASVGGGYEVIATLLYNRMLGGIPDFSRGAVIAMVMLIPSVGSICLLRYLERFNIRYSRIDRAELTDSRGRDAGWGTAGALICVAVLSIFAVIFLVPCVEAWPYQTGLTGEHFRAVLADRQLVAVYIHSLELALLTAAVGTLVAYGAALITARSTLPQRYKGAVESFSLITNAIPGMVLGVAYMFLFSGSSLQNTMVLMVLCNIVHYFSTPYLMMKNTLSKMNAGWETTAMLMGDSWLKTILRVVTPNAMSSLIEVFSYYFINAMVTISALIFIAGARTMVLTTMIKQLQYVNRFNEVFVLSLLILFTNLIAKGFFSWLAKKAPGRTK